MDTTKAFQKPGRVKSSGSDLDICRETQSLGLLAVTHTNRKGMTKLVVISPKQISFYIP